MTLRRRRRRTFTSPQSKHCCDTHTNDPYTNDHALVRHHFTGLISKLEVLNLVSFDSVFYNSGLYTSDFLSVAKEEYSLMRNAACNLHLSAIYSSTSHHEEKRVLVFF